VHHVGGASVELFIHKLSNFYNLQNRCWHDSMTHLLSDVLNNLSIQLTNHLKDTHNTSLKDYVIKFDYDGNPPKCECGVCEDVPVFSRGSFQRYALNHHKFKVREKLYIQKHGDPKCCECQNPVKFDRGIPRKYCSAKCMGKNVGFSLSTTQETIKKVVQEKYGVSNVSNLDSTKSKISSSNLGKTWKMNDEGKKKISEASKKRWTSQEYRHKMSEIVYSKDELERRSKWLKEKNQDSKFREKIFKNHKNRLSKLHQQIREKLDLGNLGFVSEQRVLKYFVDELNEDKKIIVEIYGDYPHANPKKYSQDFVVRLYGQSFTAAEKREQDLLRKSKLEEVGYTVIVVWESDDVEDKKKEIHNYLS